MSDEPELNRNNCDSSGSTPLQPFTPGLSAGALVSARDAPWRVLSWAIHDDCAEVRLRGQDDERVLLFPFDRLQPIGEVRRTKRVSRRRWARSVAALVRDRWSPARLRAISVTAAILPYQLDPALAMAGGARRVLLADEVGLGKTVQAGWILADLLARETDARVLICTPAGLKVQWNDQLHRFFDIDAAIVDARWLRRRISDLPPDVNPWCLPGIYVASLDFIKRPDITPALAAQPWDLLVVDEAHGAAAPTERHAALASIARRSRRTVLVTATPFSGDVAAFESIRALGGEGPDEIPMFRRSREDAGRPGRRRHRFALVRLHAAEVRLQRALERYTSEVWHGSTDEGDVRLAMTVLRKRALSSPAALERSLRRRIMLLGSRDPQPRQPGLFDEDSDSADDEPSAVLGAPGLDDVEREKRWLTELAGLAHAAKIVDTKRRCLSRLLARIGAATAIVFTEYRDTLHDVARGCSDALQLHGGLSLLERDSVQRRFNSQGGLLLATDAAAEGLNLHGRCRLVINYELPWNPTRIEQRIGRVDRIGQAFPVHAISLVARDTAEDLVIANLLRRLDRIARTLGARDRLAGFLQDARLAKAIIGGTSLETDRDDVVPARAISAVSPEAHMAASHLDLVRRLSAANAALADSEVVICRSRTSSAIPRGTLFVIRWRALTPHGDIAAAEILPVHAASHLDVRDPAVLRSVACVARRRGSTLLRQAVAEQSLRCDALIAREREIRDAPAAFDLQPGLFDRRVLDGLLEGRARAEELDRVQRRRIDALNETANLRSDLHLAAVLFVGGAKR